jgi:hypothetical protein
VLADPGGGIVTREILLKRLLEQPELISRFEEDLWQIEQARLQAERRLQDAEDHLLLSASPPDGKNAEIRAAQLRAATVNERQTLAAMEADVALHKSKLRVVMVEFSALKCAARLMAGTGE